MSFFTELKRRNVFRVGIAYTIVAWLVLQVADLVLENIEAPAWVMQSLMLFVAIGFPLALIFAWAFEMTPDGLKKEKDVDRSQSITSRTGQKLNVTIIALMGLALAYFIADKFWLNGDVAPIADTKSANISAEPIQPASQPNEAEASNQNSIAVLPFVNMSSDPEQEFFSDGLSEELLNLLAKIPELQVTSRSSAFSFKGQNADIPTVASKLGVANVLEGSVRKAGNRVRVTAQLIRAEDDVHLWSEIYDRELDDVFAIQDEIAGHVVAALQIRLLGRTLKTSSTDTEAYTAYLKGRHFLSEGDRRSRDAEAAFRAALEIDPGYAPAWAGLSAVLRNLSDRREIDLVEGYEQARSAAGKALEIDPDLPEAWAALARIQFTYDWDWDRALGTARTALLHGPNDVVALRTLAAIHEGLGQLDQALEMAQGAVKVDPLDQGSLRRLMLIRWARGEYDHGLELAREYQDMFPDSGAGPFMAGMFLLYQDQAESGLPLIEQGNDDFWITMGVGMAHHSLGNDELSKIALDRLTREYGHFGAFQVALVHAWRGEVNQAFQWLDTAFEQKDGGFTAILVDPSFHSLHDDPRWGSLLDRLGLLTYWNVMQMPSPETGP